MLIHFGVRLILIALGAAMVVNAGIQPVAARPPAAPSGWTSPTP